MKGFLVALLLLFAVPAAADQVFSFYGGVNGVWFADEPLGLPNDWELGGNAATSLSPHISLVGATYFGMENSYLRGSVGARVTATDVDNRDFSVGVGIQRHLSSEPDIRPEEWASDVTIGWRPWPANAPRAVLTAQGSYGLETETAFILLGIRYKIGGQQ